MEAYDNKYISSGGIANYLYFLNSAGNPIEPHQDILGTEHFKKLSQEVRIATPRENRARALIGAFYQRQTNHIYQNYLVPNLAPDLSVNGWPGTIWLTLQDRVDRDWAIFGEGEFDVTPKLTLIAGGRLVSVRQQPVRLRRLRQEPRVCRGRAGRFDNPPPNGAGASGGVRRCLTVNGEEAIDDIDAELASGGVAGTPCTNVGAVEDGVAVPKHTKGDGFIHRLSAAVQAHRQDDVLRDLVARIPPGRAQSRTWHGALRSRLSDQLRGGLENQVRAGLPGMARSITRSGRRSSSASSDRTA